MNITNIIKEKLSTKVETKQTNVEDVKPFGADISMRPIDRAIIPDFLFSPMFGRPRLIDINTTRQLAKSAYVDSVTDTIITQISSVNWEIVPNEGYENLQGINELCKDITKFIEDPNSTDETFRELLRKGFLDTLEIDAQVWVKVFSRDSYRNLKPTYRVAVPDSCGNRFNVVMSGRLKQLGARNMVELRVYDGSTFAKNPDIHGNLPEQCAYWQYQNTNLGIPISFNRDEIMYITSTPSSYSVYGRSKVDLLSELLTALISGESTYKELFTNNLIPPGILTFLGAHKSEIEAFQEKLKYKFLKYDSKNGFMRRVFYSLPIFNREAKYTPINITPSDIQYLESQKWFTQLVWMVFGTTPDMMGFTENSNKSTGVTQSRTFKQKSVLPRLNLFEENFNQTIMPEFGYDLKIINGRKIIIPLCVFKFRLFDLDMEIEKQKLIADQLKNGQITINEWREKNNKKPVSWGDEPFRQISQNSFGSNTNNNEKEDIEDINEQQDIDEEFTNQSEKIKKKSCNCNCKNIKKENKLKEKFNKANNEEEIERVFDEVLEDKLKQAEFEILQEITDDNNIPKIEGLDVIEKKGIVEDIVNNLKNILVKINFEDITKAAVTRSFLSGMDKVSKEMKLDFNPNQDAINFLKNYTFDNIKGMNEDLSNKLRQILQRGLLNQTSITQLTSQISDIFKTTKERAKVIARTETNRAFNEGKLNAFEQTGLDGVKIWDAVRDGRTSEICMRLDGQERKLEEPFKDPKTGEEFMTPPALPNCRSTIRFKPKPIGQTSDAEVKSIKEWTEKGESVYWQSKTLGRTRKTIYKIQNKLNLI